MSEALLDIRGPSKAYGARTVTDQVSLPVEPGALRAVIRPNGAGLPILVVRFAAGGRHG